MCGDIIMNALLKGLKLTVYFISLLLLLAVLFFIYFSTISIGKIEKPTIQEISPYSLNSSSIVYEIINDYPKPESKAAIPSNDNQPSSSTGITRTEILKRADDMISVKWVAKYNFKSKKAMYTFRKGQTYTGIPYSMDDYQVTSSSDFISKMKGSKGLYGNDCSGFVSAAWGIERQTTLSFYDALKNKTSIDGESIIEVSWRNLKPGDALLMDNGKGKGHIMLFANYETGNSDKIYVYEQNIATIVPFEPIPTARKDIRSVGSLEKSGYIPIRMMSIRDK